MYILKNGALMAIKNYLGTVLVVVVLLTTISSIKGMFLNKFLFKNRNIQQTVLDLKKLDIPTQKLFDAIEKKDKAGVIEALKDNADVNAYNSFGRTPLGWVLNASNDPLYDIAFLLLKQKNLDINKSDTLTSSSHIIFAIIYDDKHPKAQTFLQYMLANHTVDLTVVDYSNETPLKLGQRMAALAHTSQFPNPQKIKNATTMFKTLITVSSPTDLKKLKHTLWNKDLSEDVLNFIEIFARNPNAVITPEAVQFVLDLQRINLIPYFYEKLYKSDWFKKLESYPVFKVCGDLLPHAKISQATAKTFLKEQNIKGDQNLELINLAYAYAKKYDLKKIGSYIRRYMSTVAALPETIHDVNSMIASFSEGYGKSSDNAEQKEKMEIVKKPTSTIKNPDFGMEEVD